MKKANVGIVLLAAVSFAGSYAGTLMTRSPVTQPSSLPARSPIAEWLGLSAEQESAIERHDAGFLVDLGHLRAELKKERERLISAFGKADITDEDLRRQVGLVIEAHNRLERRVANHLIAVRHHLSPDQQKRLFNLCADCVRTCQQPCQCRLRELMGEQALAGGVHGHEEKK